MAFWRTIRGRLILIVLASMMPALGVILWTSLEQRDEAVRNAKQQSLLLARNFAEQQHVLTTSTEQILRTLANAHNSHESGPARWMESLREVDNHNPIYSHLLLVNPDGRIRASSKAGTKHSLADRKYLRDALATKAFSAGEYVINRTTGGASVHFAYPICGQNGEIDSVLATALDLDAYWDYIEKTKLPPGYTMSLLDHRGVKIFQHPERASATTGVGTRISEERLRQILADPNEGIYEAAGPDGTLRIYAFRKLHLTGAEQPYMIVTVGADKAVILATAHDIFSRNLILLGLALAVALGTAWLVGGASIVSRIRRLMEVARQLRDGNLAARTDLPPFKGEFGVLAQSFDEMAAALESRTAERDRTLASLQQSDERYRLIADNATDVIWSCDADRNIVYISPAIEKLLGWSPRELIGGSATKTLAPGSLATASRMFQSLVDRDASLRRPGPTTMELEQTRQDGTTVWTEVVANPFCDADGNVRGIAGVTRDITERRRAEQTVKESEEKYRRLFELESDAIFLIEKDTGRILEVNDAASALYGYSREELTAMRNVDLSAEAAKTAEATREDAHSIPIRYHRRKDGTIIPVEITASHFSWKGRPVHIAAIRNIQDRLKAQEDLRKSEERYRSIFENTLVGIFQSTPGGRYLTVNPSCASMFGYDTPEEMIASVTDIGGQLYCNPEDRRRAMDILGASNKLERFEIQCRRKDGTSIWAAINSRSVKDETGAVLLIEGIIENITERKLAEQERRTLEEQLRQAQKMEAIGTLAGGIAHDFNNILTALIGYTELARGEEHRVIRNDCLDQVLKASGRARDLVRQILTFGRMGEAEKKPVQIDPIIREGLKLLRSSLPSTIEIRQRFEAKPSVVIADPTEIHQILMNLCTNAAHAMRLKGGILEIGLSHERIVKPRALAAHRLGTGHYAKLTVSDAGHGIDPNVMGRLFEPFFTTKPHGEGTGLGLSVVYGIVKSCGGAIDITSSAGQGTTVSVYLPLAALLNTADTDKAAESRYGEGRVLLVDDEAMLVDVGARMLRSLGYQVTTRTSSVEALELFRARQGDFDVVLTDMTMPNMTGADLAEAMLAIRPDIPIILCTGYSEIMTEEKARNLGIRSYVMKPLSRQEIGQAIHQVRNLPRA